MMDDASSDSEEEGEGVMMKTLNGYYSELGGVEWAPSIAFRVNLRDNSCLICLSGVKRHQAVWNCALCYTPFHLFCIQHWAKDGIESSKNSILSEALFPGLQLQWTCPKCRTGYDRIDVPSLYKCFCGKKVLVRNVGLSPLCYWFPLRQAAKASQKCANILLLVVTSTS
jgi:NF-X1-type zinc finger protein NFXL1